MTSLRKPSPERVRVFLAGLKADTFSYAEVGATSGELPAGYNIDRTRVLLGRGAGVFERAREALAACTMFDLGWVCAVNRPPIEPGATVVVAARAGGAWWLNGCRIVYVVDESRRYGFAYGTLRRHAESGEERFLVEHRDDGSVVYEILAFSRPRHVLARMFYPWGRRLQHRFARESAGRMSRELAAEPGAAERLP